MSDTTLEELEARSNKLYEEAEELYRVWQKKHSDWLEAFMAFDRAERAMDAAKLNSIKQDIFHS